MRAAVSKLVGSLLLVLAGGVAHAAAITPDPWPREFTTPKGNTAVMYQPQIETFKGDTMSGRAAISVTKKGETAPKFGVIFFTASVSVDRDDRSVEIRRIKVNRVRFPNITPDKEKTFAGIVEAEVPKWNLVISYDRVIEAVKVAGREKKSAQGLKNDPPKVLFAQEPTVLVTLDGEPQLREVEGTPLKVVVNTPLFMVLDTRNNRYYLSGGKKWWYEAPDAKGPWRSIGGPPSDIADLAAQATDAQKKGDKDTPDEDGTEAANPPKIAVATGPTELIVSEGKPSFKPVAGAGADLLSMENTESDVLLDVPTQNYYALLSGRWFKSRSLGGGTFAYVPPDQLPASFAKIPPDSDIGEIRASVPGTDEAEDALLDAQIPQTTAVKRADAKLAVQYDGEPNFVPIEGTKTEYAINTPTSVLRIARPLLCLRQRGVVRRGRADGPVDPRGLDSDRRRGPDSAERARLQREIRARLRLDAGRSLFRLHARLRGLLPMGRHRRLGHGLALPPLDRPGLLVAAPVYVGLPRALHAVVRLGLRLVVELSLLQHELRLGRLVPPGRLGPSRSLRRRRGRRIPARLVRTRRVPPADGHREQLLGESPRRDSPARLESPRCGSRSGPAPSGNGPAGPSGHRVPPTGKKHPPREGSEQHLRPPSRACA